MFFEIFFGNVPLERSRREGGGGTRPQGVFDIRRPRVAGGRACVDRVTSSYQFLLVKSFFNGPRGSAARAQMLAVGTVPRVGQSLFPLKLAILGQLWPF